MGRVEPHLSRRTVKISEYEMVVEVVPMFLRGMSMNRFTTPTIIQTIILNIRKEANGSGTVYSTCFEIRIHIEQLCKI
jgi:hypothetical protein